MRFENGDLEWVGLVRSGTWRFRRGTRKEFGDYLYGGHYLYSSYGCTGSYDCTYSLNCSRNDKTMVWSIAFYGSGRRSEDQVHLLFSEED